MKKRNLILIAIVAVVAVAALVIALRGSRKATFPQDYHIEDIASVTRIFMADKQNQQVLLVRTGDSSWAVDCQGQQYQASQSMVNLLLETLNTMRIRQQVNRSAVPTIIKDLSARAIKVEVYQRKPFINWFGGRLRLFPHEKLTVTYFVGRETQDMMASYMFREGDKVPYVIHIPGFRGFPSPRFVTDPLKWRSHTIVDLNVRAIERVELNIPDLPEESFAIQREGEGFYLELSGNRRAAGFDTARVAQMLSCFTYLNFDEFAAIVPNSFADSCVSGTPRTILSITDTAGNTHVLRSYIKYNNPDDMLAIPDPKMYETFDLDRLYAIVDDRDTVLIQYFIFDNILQPVSYFLGHDKQIIAK
ncbi:MAG: DUF4340 domain-containing protein [Bacteroidales bacterium]|nr:DUF4340 domain-containing protein [Bacteroidales bacterium]